MNITLNPDGQSISIVFIAGDGEDAREVFVAYVARAGAFAALDALRDACAKML